MLKNSTPAHLPCAGDEERQIDEFLDAADLTPEDRAAAKLLARSALRGIIDHLKTRQPEGVRQEAFAAGLAAVVHWYQQAASEDRPGQRS